jgi:hypothetical protein
MRRKLAVTPESIAETLFGIPPISIQFRSVIALPRQVRGGLSATDTIAAQHEIVSFSVSSPDEKLQIASGQYEVLIVPNPLSALLPISTTANIPIVGDIRLPVSAVTGIRITGLLTSEFNQPLKAVPYTFVNPDGSTIFDKFILPVTDQSGRFTVAAPPGRVRLRFFVGTPTGSPYFDLNFEAISDHDLGKRAVN